MVTTSVINTDNETISVRKCSEPEEKAKQIYDVLGYTHKPFIRKKSVVPHETLKKIKLQEKRGLRLFNCNVG